MKSPANVARGAMGLVLGSALMFLAACSGSTEAPAQPQAGSKPEPSVSASTPVHVLLKVPAGQTAPASLSQDIAQWKQSGTITDATRLDSAEAAEHDLSTLVILDFPSEDAYQAWNAQNASSLGSQVTAKRAELYLSGGTHTVERENAHYMVHIHGIPTAPQHADEYKDFLDSYMSPLLKGQHEAGVLRGYRLFIERDENGAIGDSIWAAQYKDADAYGRTSAIKVKIREDLLANDPGFAKYRSDAYYKGLREALAYYPAHYTE